MNGIAMTNSMPMTWARRLTLAVGVPLAVTLIGWTGFSVVALAGQASYRVSYLIPVHDGQLSANLNGANMTLRQGSGQVARLAGTVHYSLVRPSLTEHPQAAGTAISFHCQVPTGICSLNATLDVPPRTAVAVSSGGGDLSVSGFASDLTLQTGGGDLGATRLTGRLRLTSDGGDIEAGALASPDVIVSTGGGDVMLTFTRPPGNVQVNSGGGDIQIVLPRGDTAYNVVSSTGGGDLNDSVPHSTSSPDTITVNSGGGDIDIT
jgi:Putative adhesin